MTITLSGVGAFFGLAKAYNGGELTSIDDAVLYEHDVLDFNSDF